MIKTVLQNIILCYLSGYIAKNFHTLFSDSGLLWVPISAELAPNRAQCNFSAGDLKSKNVLLTKVQLSRLNLHGFPASYQVYLQFLLLSSLCLAQISFVNSTNVLLQEGAAKITDVGMARLMSDAYFTQDASIGTFSWAAPEVLLGEK